MASYERALAATVDDPYAFSGAADCVMKLCDWDKRTRFAADVNAHVSGKKSIVYPFVLLGYSDDPDVATAMCQELYREYVFVAPATILVGPDVAP